MRNWVMLIALPICLVGPAPTPARASGIDLGWGTCAMSSANRDVQFACDTNDRGGPFKLVIAFRSPVDVPTFVAEDIVLDIKGELGGLPDWWMIGNGGCRIGSFVFPGPTTSLGGTCAQIPATWVGGGFHPELIQGGGENHLRLTLSRNLIDPVLITAGVRYVAGVALIDQAYSIDDGSGAPVCAGCLDGVCLVLNSVILGALVPSQYVTLETAEFGQYVTWQGGPHGWSSCPGAVETRSRTWGAIKTLYR